MSARLVSLALGAALLTLGCDDPVEESAVAALGPENPRVPVGPLHRAGQPCVACHQDGGPAALAFSFGGTVYQTESGKAPLVAGLVRLTDATGKSKVAETNCAGNFYLEAVDFAPTFPVHAEVIFGATSATMLSHIGVDGSCADCHTGKDSAKSVDHIYLAQDPVTFPPTGCR